VLLGELYLELAEYRKSVDNCRRAISLERNTQSAYTTLADALLFLGRQQESVAAIQEMERVRQEAWEQYQARFSGQDRADAERL
jgi:sulfur carrier protein ThiS